MQRLASDDIERVRLFLEETAQVCDLASFGAVVLPAVRRLVPSEIACYAQVDPVQGKLVAQETWPDGAFSRDLRAAFERYMLEHPIFQEWTRTGVSSALRTSELLTKREWHRRELYQTVYKQLGCDDSMPIGLPAPDGLIACVCLERDTEFNERAVYLMELIRPHVVQMYRTAEMFSLLDQAAPPDGVRSMVLDRAGRPLLATPAAWDLIAAYFPGRSAFAGAFPRSIRDWLRAQLARFSREHELPPPASPFVITNDHGDRLTLRLLYGGKTGDQALLVLQERRVTPPATVAPHLGLSPREQEVLRLVRDGRTSAEIAGVLTVSRRTVEKHLENIYCKLGVENRTAAVTVAFSPERAP
jgi:DNA-binding CsgD family transcriptional regulator